MERKIFLGKYRVATTKSAQWWAAQRSYFRCEAEEIRSGKRVILELLPLSLLGRSEQEACDRRAAVAGHLRHPNLPALYGLGKEDGFLILATEELEGVSVAAWPASYGQMSPASAVGVALQVASALRVLLQHAIPQPPVQPSEILLVPGCTTEDDEPLVKLANAFELRGWCSLGSEFARDRRDLFLSPEAQAGAPLDFRDRAYSIGAMIWFLVNGKPLSLPAGAADEQDPVTAGDASLGISAFPEALRQLLAHLLSRNRDQRPLDPTSLEGAIRRCLNNLRTEKPAERGFPIMSRPSNPPKAPRWRRMGVALLATAGAAAMVAGAFATLTGKASAIRNENRERADRSGEEAVIANREASAATNLALDSPLFRSAYQQISVVSEISRRTAAPKDALDSEPVASPDSPVGPVVQIVTNPNNVGIGNKPVSAAPSANASSGHANGLRKKRKKAHSRTKRVRTPEVRRAIAIPQ